MDERIGLSNHQANINTILNWLHRRQPSRGNNVCYDLPVVLSTDIGLKRQENQDRVAAIRIGKKANGAPPLAAVIVADGMGGMKQGAECATVAISSFMYTLIASSHLRVESQIHEAITIANSAVYDFASGGGGTTLSALVYSNPNEAFIVNIGDSRAYAWQTGEAVKRLTVDDSLEEAVGGHGRDLLQFVGMGEGIRPHILQLDKSIEQIALTTDGIHFVESGTFHKIILNTTDPKSLVERLSALSRWCGGHDNASMAYVNLKMFNSIFSEGDDTTSISDPFGTLAMATIPEFKASEAVVKSQEPKANLKQPVDERPKKTKPPRGGKSKNKKENKSDEPDNVQLEIKIENTGGGNE